MKPDDMCWGEFYRLSVRHTALSARFWDRLRARWRLNTASMPQAVRRPLLRRRAGILVSEATVIWPMAWTLGHLDTL